MHLAIFTSLVCFTTAQQIPAITAPVNDLAGVISDGEEALLTTHVEELRTKTGVQLAILVVTNLPYATPIEDFSLAVAEQWKGGSASRDDGILLTLAMTDRKSRLEVGYGLEPLLTDGEAGAILQGMREKLRQNDVGGALIDATLRVHDEVASLTPESSRTLLKAAGVGLIVYRAVRLLIAAALIGLLALIAVLSLRQKRSPRPPWVPRLVRHRIVAVVAWLVACALFIGVDRAFSSGERFVFMVSTIVASSIAFGSAATATEASTLKWATLCAAVMTTIGILVFAFIPFAEEAALMQVLIGSTFTVPFTLGFAGRIDGGSGDSSSGGSSSSSGSWSSSSSSSSSDYSGGGGSFGGGGASSDW
jgi:uncharacterized protein